MGKGYFRFAWAFALASLSPLAQAAYYAWPWDAKATKVQARDILFFNENGKRWTEFSPAFELNEVVEKINAPEGYRGKDWGVWFRRQNGSVFQVSPVVALQVEGRPSSHNPVTFWPYYPSDPHAGGKPEVPVGAEGAEAGRMRHIEFFRENGERADTSIAPGEAVERVRTVPEAFAYRTWGTWFRRKEDGVYFQVPSRLVPQIEWDGASSVLSGDHARKAGEPHRPMNGAGPTRVMSASLARGFASSPLAGEARVAMAPDYDMRILDSQTDPEWVRARVEMGSPDGVTEFWSKEMYVRRDALKGVPLHTGLQIQVRNGDEIFFERRGAPKVISQREGDGKTYRIGKLPSLFFKSEVFVEGNLIHRGFYVDPETGKVFPEYTILEDPKGVQHAVATDDFEMQAELVEPGAPPRARTMPEAPTAPRGHAAPDETPAEVPVASTANETEAIESLRRQLGDFYNSLPPAVRNDCKNKRFLAPESHRALLNAVRGAGRDNPPPWGRSDLVGLTMTVFGEARGMGCNKGAGDARQIANQAAVLQVLHNRHVTSYRSGDPSTRTGAATAKLQFSCWNRNDGNLCQMVNMLDAKTAGPAKMNTLRAYHRFTKGGVELPDSLKNPKARHYLANYVEAQTSWATADRKIRNPLVKTGGQSLNLSEAAPGCARSYHLFYSGVR